MRTRLVIAILLCALAAYLMWSRQRANRTPMPAVSTRATAGLDVAAFRDHLASRRAAARALAERHARAAAGAGSAAPGTDTPDGPDHRLTDLLVAPVCILGPADLCASIADTVAACDRGDGPACLAVGQFLEDAPPRPMILISFYLAACEHGEDDGCTAKDRFREDAHGDCAADPLPCAWRALNDADPDGLDRACTLGVADACAMALELAGDDRARARHYLEVACQLGNPMTCNQLGRRLSPSCTGADCYPPDPAAALAASTIACDVGFTSACAAVPR